MIKDYRLNFRNFISFILFCINPFICYVYSTLSYIKGRGKNSVFFLSLSLAIIFIYLPIMYDTSANFYKVHYLMDGEIPNLYNWFAVKIRSYITIDFYYFIFLYVFVILYSWFKCVGYQYDTSEKYKTIYLLIVALFSLNYRDIMDINRNCYAYSVFLIYYYYLKDRFPNFKIFFLLLTLSISISIHISAILLWLIFLITNIRKFKGRALDIAFYMSVVLAFVMPIILNLSQGILGSIGGAFTSRLMYYLYDSGFAVQDFTISTLMKKILNFILIFFIGILCILDRKRNNDSRINLILILCTLSLLFSSYVTLFERISLAVTLLYFFAIFKINGFPYLKKIILLLIVSRTVILNLLVYFPIFIGDYSNVLPNYNNKLELEAKPFYLNTFYLLDIDNGYSDKYLIRNDIWGK